MASRFTKTNPKLSNEMMVAATVPYLLEALRHVEASTVSIEYEWINRAYRARTDRCVCLEVPIALGMRTDTSWQELPFALRLFLRNDTQQMIEWIAKHSEASRPVVRKAEIEFRRRLRRSSAAKVKELSKHWAHVGHVVAVDLDVSEFAELVRAATASE